MFRTNLDNVDALVREVETTQWFDKKFGTWVVAFVVHLMRRGVSARKADSKNLYATEMAHRLAFHLGQLIEDPVWAREEERQEQQRRRVQYEEAVAFKERYGSPIPKYTLWNADEAQAEVDGNFNDHTLANSFLRRLVIAFGLLDQLKAALPAMQLGDDPLFTVDAWPRWWAWAEDGFFYAETPEETTAQ